MNSRIGTRGWASALWFSLAVVCAQDPTSSQKLLTDPEMVVPLEASPPAADPAAVDWVLNHGHAIRSLTSADFSDLAFLKPILEEKSIVQLGESAHGAREYSQVKVRLIRFLHEELGFNVLAFESSLYQCYRADAMVPEAVAATAMSACLFGVWHTETLKGLFEYIRETRKTGSPLRIAGFDIQPIGWNKKGRPDFLRRVVGFKDAEYAKTVFDRDAAFLAEYAKGSKSLRTVLRANPEEWASAYDSLASFLRQNFDISHLPEGLSSADWLTARQTAYSISQYIRQQTAPSRTAYSEARDEGMARNLRFLAEELYPDEKLIAWGHNSHLRYASDSNAEDHENSSGRPMGYWTAQWSAERVYTIGLYAYRGQMAGNNSRQAYDVAPASDGSLEALLHRAQRRCVFVDLSSADRDRAPWIFHPLSAKFAGLREEATVPRQWYDGILFVDSVSVPSYLGSR